MRLLVTGSAGLIGSEAALHFGMQGREVHGVDNNMRQQFFGKMGDTRWNLERPEKSLGTCYHHHDFDIRHFEPVEKLFVEHPFDCVIHCAAQPSHDKAKNVPLIDFQVNAVGTVNLLEATRRHASDAVFIHISTNKV